MKIASLNVSSPPNEEELLHLEQEKLRHPQHIHPHHRPSTSQEKPKIEEETKLPSRTSSSQEHEEKTDDETSDKEDDEENEEQADEVDEQEMKKLRANADRLFPNNNVQYPDWWKLSMSQAINEDTRNNNLDNQRKTPGFYCQTHRSGAGSDQNLHSAVLFEGAPTIKLEHPYTSFYGEGSSRPSNVHKNPSWDGKHFDCSNCANSTHLQNPKSKARPSRAVQLTSQLQSTGKRATQSSTQRRLAALTVWLQRCPWQTWQLGVDHNITDHWNKPTPTPRFRVAPNHPALGDKKTADPRRAWTGRRPSIQASLLETMDTRVWLAHPRATLFWWEVIERAWFL